MTTSYDLGYDAYLRGDYHDDNPFFIGSLDYELWDSGWNDAAITSEADITVE